MRVSVLYSLRELRVFGFICAASCLGRVVPLTQIYSSWNTFFFTFLIREQFVEVIKLVVVLL